MRRAAQLLKIASEKELVLDVHDLPLGPEAEFMAIVQDGDPRLLGVAALLGIRNILLYTTAMVCETESLQLLRNRDKTR